MNLQEVLAALEALPDQEREAIVAEAVAATKDLVWVPNPGPQTEAYYCEADEVLFGGEPGGGKSQVLIGLAVNVHERSLLLRRTNKEASKFVQEIEDVIGSRDGYNGQRDEWRFNGKLIDIGGVQHEDDKQKYKGNPHDLIGFDELPDFSESQYMFIRMWNRSTKPGQRCRTISSSNGPSSPEGMWVVRRWAAWLDPRHPNPAKSGEIRWYLVGDDGVEREVDGPGPYEVLGRTVTAASRTFIRSRLDDNPDLAATNYGSQLMAQSGTNRKAYALGEFAAMLEDHPFQAIPTDWVLQAQARWRPVAPVGIPMCAMGVDVAQGGNDKTVLAWRHDGWFAPLVAIPGKDTPGGSDIAGVVISKRRDGCKVVIDIGGGWGGDAYAHLRENGVDAVSYMGVKTSNRRTEDNLIKFFNVRTEAYWRLREALNPDQPGGSHIMLPDDQELLSDLTAATYEIRGNHGCGVLHLESKESLVKRLGRSTDKGDAVAMAWFAGAKAITDLHIWGQQHKGRAAPKVIMRRP